MKEIYLAGGCFWGVQKKLDKINGILETEVGYANGNTENPTYEEVCNGSATHAEAVKVIYDDKRISTDELLEKFYKFINPTTLNKQGVDRGKQYRSGIYFLDVEDKNVALEVTARQQENYSRKIVVEILPLKNFYKAEEYHQKYFER